MDVLMLAITLFSQGPPGVPSDSMADSLQAYLRPTNQNKMMIVVPPMGAEIGALSSVPVAWFAGWMATGFKIETEYTSCGMPSGCNCVISYPVFWTVIGLGSAGCAIGNAAQSNRWGRKLDRDQARAEYILMRERRENRPGRLVISHIWYFGAGGFEYGYNMNRLTIGRFNYVLPSAYLGLGFEGPSYFLIGRKWGKPLINLYLMPYYHPYRIGNIDFLRNLYLFIGFQPGARDSVSHKVSFNAGIAFSAGSMLTLKIGAAQNLSDTLQTGVNPSFYVAVEAEWGSWFFTSQYRPSRRWE
jgi:hypothetical protein